MILKHDWRKQCQLTFNFNIPDSKTEDWLMIYYKMSQRSKHKNIACGSFHTIIQKADGALMSTGLNEQGQLGLGVWNNINTFTEVPNIPKDIIAVACGSYHARFQRLVSLGSLRSLVTV